MDSKVDWEIALRIVFIGTIVQDYGSIWQTRSFCCAELIIYIYYTIYTYDIAVQILHIHIYIIVS
jgi:hypothetical protein